MRLLNDTGRIQRKWPKRVDLANFGVLAPEYQRQTNGQGLHSWLGEGQELLLEERPRKQWKGLCCAKYILRRG